jgi:hypothetical protein
MTDRLLRAEDIVSRIHQLAAISEAVMGRLLLWRRVLSY